MSTIFEKTSDGNVAARIGSTVYGIIESAGAFIIRTTFSNKPIADIHAADFYGHDGKFDTMEAARAEVEDIERDHEQKKSFRRISESSSARTPWGESQGVVHYADGIVSHSTAGHGGFKLDRKRNAQVHPALREQGGWYEEDLDWAKVAHTFPEFFSEREKKRAERILMDWHPDEYESATGVVLTEDMSHRRAEQAFERRHAEDYVVISASGKGDVVHCTASKGGKRSRYEGNVLIEVDTVDFVVSSQEYAKRGPFGFVIDEERHSRLEPEAPSLKM